MEKKELLRNNIKTLLASISDIEYQRLSEEIANQLFHSSLWKESKTIALTISRQREVDTYRIIERAWEEGKRVAVPRTQFQDRKMTFHKLTTFSNLEKRSIGLMEPIVDCPIIETYEFDLVVVPGLAFDHNGNRLGFGGGFYDRFLPTVSVPTLALAFECQIVDLIPVEEHDRPIDHIVLPSGFIR